MDLQLFEYLQTYLTERRKQLFQEVLEQRTRHFTVVMEDVYQLHNTSAVMRSCDVFGVQDLHVIEERLGKRVDKEIAMGAQKWVDIHRYQSAEECIESLRSNGYQIVATTPHGEAQFLEDFDVSKKSALFFGTEKKGLSHKVLQEADVNLKIPMYGFTESLNISVSAAIILQHMVGEMRRKKVAWQLSKEDRFDLELAWTRKSIKNVDQIVERYLEQKKV